MTRATPTATCSPPTGARPTPTPDANNCHSCGNVCPSRAALDRRLQRQRLRARLRPRLPQLRQQPQRTAARSTAAPTSATAAPAAACAPRATPPRAARRGGAPSPPATPASRTATNKVPDGCEVNTTNDPDNCGMCGTICSTPNATPGCTNGMCSIASRNPGYLDCDGNVAKRVRGQRPQQRIRNNCGACNRFCNVPNGTPGVYRGNVSGIASCNPGFKDCDNSPRPTAARSTPTPTRPTAAGAATPARSPTPRRAAPAGLAPSARATPGSPGLRRQRGRRLRDQHPDRPQQLRRLRQRVQAPQRDVGLPDAVRASSRPATRASSTATATRPTAARSIPTPIPATAGPAGTKCCRHANGTAGCSGGAVHPRELQRGLRRLRRQPHQRLRDQHRDQPRRLRRLR